MQRSPGRPQPARPSGWVHPIPILTNRFVLRDLLIAIGGLLVALWVTVAVAGWLVEGIFWRLPAQALGGIGLGVLAIAGLLGWAVFRNHVAMTYLLMPGGVRVIPAPRHPADGRRERLAGALARRLTGLHPLVRDSGTVAWWEVQHISVYPEIGVIALDSRWRTVLRLYCPPARLSEVANQIHDLVARDVARRPPRPSPRFYAPHVAWSVLALLGALAVRAWSPGALDTHEPALVIGALVIAGGLRPTQSARRLGLLALLWSLFLALMVVGVAFDDNPVAPNLAMPSAGPIHAPSLALSLAGLATLATLGLISLSGRTPAHRRVSAHHQRVPAPAAAPVPFAEPELVLHEAGD